MDDRELYLAALARAPHGRASSREVAALRAFTHAEMLAGRIDGATQDRIGQLVDAIEQYETVTVGDYLRGGVSDIAWNVLEVVDDEGTTWRRAFGAERFTPEREGLFDGEEYDWITEGGLCTTDGLLLYAPLRVTKVVREPADGDGPRPPARSVRPAKKVSW